MDTPHDERRRQTLVLLAQTGSMLPLLLLSSSGCGSSKNQNSTTQESQGANQVEGSDVAGASASTTTVDAAKWATGGVAAMTASASYPNPFASTLGNACTLTCQATAGPCYLASGDAPTRQDVSEGQDGLPMRLTFKIVDEGCVPLVGATLQIWHCSPGGLYSGHTPNEGFCSNSNQAAISAQWLRGSAVSNAEGVVVFDSCFPGWYQSRTIHIHVTLKTDSGDSITTQFFFEDALCDAIVADQPLYKDRGSRDTTNQNDTVVSATAAPSYCFDVAQMSDGAMLASKTIVVRSSTDTAVCTVPGGTKGGTGAGTNTPGGPPPGAKWARSAME